MKFIFTKHALDKIVIIGNLGWDLNENKIKQIIKKPGWRGKSNFGQETAMELMDENHIARIVFNREDGIIKIITLHITRRGRYESTLR